LSTQLAAAAVCLQGRVLVWRWEDKSGLPTMLVWALFHAVYIPTPPQKTRVSRPWSCQRWAQWCWGC
jgi:hypothetical protein